MTEQTSSSSPKITLKRSAALLNCGLVSGLSQAYVFNPWDRALYLSVKHNRPFLTMTNFLNPMAGVTQTVVQRAISAGLYFPLEQLFAELLDSWDVEDKQDDPSNRRMRQWRMFLAGTFAGIINGIVMNPFTRIKVNFFSSSLFTLMFFVVSLLGKTREYDQQFLPSGTGNLSTRWYTTFLRGCLSHCGTGFDFRWLLCCPST